MFLPRMLSLKYTEIFLMLFVDVCVHLVLCDFLYLHYEIY